MISLMKRTPMSWMQCLLHVFDIDIRQSRRCGAASRVLAPTVISLRPAGDRHNRRAHRDAGGSRPAHRVNLTPHLEHVCEQHTQIGRASHCSVNGQIVLTHPVDDILGPPRRPGSRSGWQRPK